MGVSDADHSRVRYAVTAQLVAQLVLALLVLLGGGGVAWVVLRGLFAPNPALAQAEQRIARVGASLGGVARQAGWETADGVWIQAGWRRRHGKPAEPSTWVGRGAVPRLETQPMIVLRADGSVTSADVALPIARQDERVAAVRAAGLPMPVRLAWADDRVVGLVVTGLPTDDALIVRAVAVFRAL